jgi:hypothetical protein
MLVLQEFDHIIGKVARVKSKRSPSSTDGFVGFSRERRFICCEVDSRRKIDSR